MTEDQKNSIIDALNECKTYLISIASDLKKEKCVTNFSDKSLNKEILSSHAGKLEDERNKQVGDKSIIR